MRRNKQIWDRSRPSRFASEAGGASANYCGNEDGDFHLRHSLPHFVGCASNFGSLCLGCRKKRCGSENPRNSSSRLVCKTGGASAFALVSGKITLEVNTVSKVTSVRTLNSLANLIPSSKKFPGYFSLYADQLLSSPWWVWTHFLNKYS